MLCILALVPTILAQDDVQVDCTPDHMEIRVTKGKTRTRTWGRKRRWSIGTLMTSALTLLIEIPIL